MTTRLNKETAYLAKPSATIEVKAGTQSYLFNKDDKLFNALGLIVCATADALSTPPPATITINGRTSKIASDHPLYAHLVTEVESCKQ